MVKINRKDKTKSLNRTTWGSQLESMDSIRKKLNVSINGIDRQCKKERDVQLKL